jgi:hypothetical protein
LVKVYSRRFTKTKMLPRSGFRYVLAVAAAFGAFLLFAATQSAGPATPFRSLATASFIVAAGAAVFAYRWPHRAWLWGLLLCGAFWPYLGIVFVSILAEGGLDGWPLIDASIIGAASFAGAALGRAASPSSAPDRAAEAPAGAGQA